MHYQSTCMSYWSKDLQINVRTHLRQGLYVRLPKTVQIIQNTIINNISCTSTFLCSVDMLQLRGAIRLRRLWPDGIVSEHAHRYAHHRPTLIPHI